MSKRKLTLSILMVLMLSSCAVNMPYKADLASSVSSLYSSNLTGDYKLSEHIEFPEANYCDTPEFEYEDYKYKLVDDDVMITRYFGDKTDVMIPNEICGKKVVILASGAFNKCLSVESITIPETVEIISFNPFFRCESLSEIKVDSNNKYFTSYDGVLFNKGLTVLLVYPEGRYCRKYQVLGSVTQINNGAFGYSCNAIEVLSIHSGVTYMPDYVLAAYPVTTVLEVEQNSEAEKYAKKYGIGYFYLN